MKSLILIAVIIFIISYSTKSQTNDTLAAKVIWIKNLKECLLIGVVPFCNTTDTIVLISPVKNVANTKNRKEILVGEPFIFISEKETIIASPTKKMSVKFKNTIVWTDEEPDKLRPRLCLNCYGQYVK